MNGVEDRLLWLAEADRALFKACEAYHEIHSPIHSELREIYAMFADLKHKAERLERHQQTEDAGGPA
jgi:hypothetical protein